MVPQKPSPTPSTSATSDANHTATGDRVRTQHANLQKRLDKWSWQRAEYQKQLNHNQRQQQRLKEYLDLAPEVSEALQVLSAELFEQDLRILQEKLSIALNEVLGQPIRFRAEPGFRGNVATVDFSIERDGHLEDVRRGQGGSVHNVLSVGLRMFALTTLDRKHHRPFLVLDEQDCWLRPELVPKLVKIVHEAGRELDYQVIMISHHDLNLFEQYAERIYRFVPGADGVDVQRVSAQS